LVDRKGNQISELDVCTPVVMLAVQMLNEACSDVRAHADWIS
jgi:hypothetical protein